MKPKSRNASLYESSLRNKPFTQTNRSLSKNFAWSLFFQAQDCVSMSNAHITTSISMLKMQLGVQMVASYFCYNCLNWIHDFNKTFWCCIISKLTFIFLSTCSVFSNFIKKLLVRLLCLVLYFPYLWLLTYRLFNCQILFISRLFLLL